MRFSLDKMLNIKEFRKMFVASSLKKSLTDLTHFYVFVLFVIVRRRFVLYERKFRTKKWKIRKIRYSRMTRPI